MTSGPRREIWAVGGGKGGVGKSIVTANLGVCLARRGYSCALVDADLGGSNLHTIIGAPHPRFTLSDFLTRVVETLDEVLSPTPVSRLFLISGARALIESANINYAQKMRLIRHLSYLKLDFVLLDLGAGTSFNTLDLFLAAQRGILVVLPEPTSIENVYHFLRTAFFRRIGMAAKELGLDEIASRIWEERVSHRIRSPRQLLSTIAESDPAGAEKLTAAARELSPFLLMNQVRGWDDAALGREISIASHDYLGVEVRVCGGIPYDERIRDALRQRRPSMEVNPYGPFSLAIADTVDQLLTSEAPQESIPGLQDDYRLLRLKPGSRLVDILSAHKQMKELYSRGSLATQSLIDDEDRLALLRQIDEACDRIVGAYSSPSEAQRGLL